MDSLARELQGGGAGGGGSKKAKKKKSQQHSGVWMKKGRRVRERVKTAVMHLHEGGSLEVR